MTRRNRELLIFGEQTDISNSEKHLAMMMFRQVSPVGKKANL